MKGTLRTCNKGHQYYKSSDCPVCPVCALQDKKKNSFIAGLSAPALRALAGAGIKSVGDLSKFTEADIAALHGMGPNGLLKIKAALQKEGLKFRKG